MSSVTTSELERIRAEYARRASDKRLRGLYSAFNPANLFMMHSRERALIKLLRAEQIVALEALCLLDLGCGEAGELLRFQSYGFSPRTLYGCDLVLERLNYARKVCGQVGLAQANGGDLPFRDAAFDIVMQFGVFSSILDSWLKSRIASEMLRVLKAGGLLLWYDFWINPTNPMTRGIRPREIKRLFPDCLYRFSRVTLAPPISRRVAPISWTAAHLLEQVPFLRSHYLVGIRKPESYGT